jgi:uroporphyrinogen decarboxylase
MATRQTVIDSLEHRQPAAIPYNIAFTQPARQKMAKFYSDDAFDEKLGNALHCLGTTPQEAWREVRPDVWEDEFGVQWDRSVDKDIGVVCNRKITEETLEEYQFPDPAAPHRWESYPIKRTNADAGPFYVANHGFSLFERAWTLFGMEELLMAMVSRPEAAHRLLDRILEYNLAIIQEACSRDVDAMMFGDDWGSQYGLLMGPDLWREFIKPRVRSMYQEAKAHGKYVFIHSCGKVNELFPELIECGLDCFNPFQPEVMDVEDMKTRYGDRLSFYGGISTQRTLPYGEEEQVREEVRRLLNVVGRGGGLIAAPAHAIPGDAKPENIHAMIEVLQNQ